MKALSIHFSLLVLMLALSVLVERRPLAATFALAWRNDEYTHIFLILPLSVALIVLQWQFLRKIAGLAVRTGSAVLAVSLVIACCGLAWHASLAPDLQLFLGMLALVLWWIGTFVLCMGATASRSSLFPLLFLFGLVPIPQSALNVLISLLQQGSAWSASALFSLFGVPLVHDGVYLAIPGMTVVVAQECSSIRSTSMLLVTTLVLAQLLLRSPWRRTLLVLLAVPLSIAKNGLRVFIISMLTIKVDPGYMSGKFHRQGGSVFFLIALFGIFAILWILRRGEGSTLGAASPSAAEMTAQV